QVDADVAANLPISIRVAHAVQRSQHEAAAHEQPRPECANGADLDEIDEGLVIGCDADHGKSFRRPKKPMSPASPVLAHWHRRCALLRAHLLWRSQGSA